MRKNGFLFGCIVFIFSNCTSEKKVPDVSQINVDIQIQRFDKDLFALDTIQFDQQATMLKEKYPVFLPEVYALIVQDRMNPDTSLEAILEPIVKNPALRKLADTCQIVFGDLAPIRQELNQAFRFFKYYFPDKPVPQVVTYISEFALGTFTYGDSLMGVGLDFFLGEGYPGYNISYFPTYIQRSMDQQHMVPKMMEAVASNLVGNPPGNRLLDHMICNGKILYLKDLFLPLVPDSVKLEYTTQQTDWVQNNEFEMWTHFLKEDLLYSTKKNEIQKLIYPSPIAPGGMPQEAPGRTANWLGWQIIKAYMARNPAITLEQLLAETDAQKILENSRYKPKR